MRNLLTLILITFSLLSHAQNKKTELITDRPDQTESAAIVAHKSLQIETGFILENNKTSLTKEKSFAYNSTLLRYGLFENFELRLGLEYLGSKTSSKHTETNYNTSGLSPLYTGFKIKIADEDGWKPELAFLGGLALPFTADKDFKPEYSAADIRFAFAHTLSDKVSIGYNIGAEWDGETAEPAYFYSMSLAIGLTDNLSIFAESFGSIPEKGGAEHLLDTGFTYLVSPNFQLDISGGIGLNDHAVDNFLSFGLTYRFLN